MPQETENEVRFRDVRGHNLCISVLFGPDRLVWRAPYDHTTEIRPEEIRRVSIRCGGKSIPALIGGCLAVIGPFIVVALVLMDPLFRKDLGISSLFSGALWGLVGFAFSYSALVARLALFFSHRNCSLMRIVIEGDGGEIVRHKDPICLWRSAVDTSLTSPDDIVTAFQDWASLHCVACDFDDLRVETEAKRNGV